MKKINSRLKDILLIVLMGILLVLVFCYLGIDNYTYAIDVEDDYLGDYELNPEWVEYMQLSDEEKAKYELIPEKFIIRYEDTNSGISLFSFASNYPEYYNLVDEGESTPLEDQGSLGLCWAFSALSSVETYMLKNGLSDNNNLITFSERQLDYAAVSPNYIIEKYNPYYVVGRYSLGYGAYNNTAYKLFESGISPVTTEVFGEFNEDTTTKKSMNDVFSVDNVEYVVDGYVNIGTVDDETSTATRESWVNAIKDHVMNYGSVSIGTIGPHPYYAGSCIYTDYENQNYMLNVSGECNPSVYPNKHSMSIVGWDDNYKYEYCRNENSTTNDLTNCTNIVSGTGAFILKNSWGDVLPYPYLAYTSNAEGAYGITGMSVKTWDVNYDSTKSYESSYKSKQSIVTYDRSTEISERLKKISFNTSSKNAITYNVYVSANGSNSYTKVGSVDASYVGMYSINVDDILLTGNSFSIKITSSSGVVSDVYAYTEYVDEDEDIVIDTNIKTGTEYHNTVIDFSLYTMTRNLDSGVSLEYRLIDSNGNDISDLITVTNTIVLNGIVNPTFVFNDALPSGKVTLEVVYQDKVYDSVELNITSLENLWSGGSGTVADPFLVKDLEDFLKIYTNEEYMAANYKLVGDIDFSSIDDWSTGDYTKYKTFRGSLDGDGHVLYGLKSYKWFSPIFYIIRNATFKNLVLSDFDIQIESTGWGTLLGTLAYDSIFENIIITDTIKIIGSAAYAGGIVGNAFDCKIINVANYGDVTTDYSESGKAAGIVGGSYGSILKNVYNYGNITADGSLAAGIVSHYGSNSNTGNISEIYNAYNFGDVISNNYAGGIVGFGAGSIISNCYNVYSKYPNTTATGKMLNGNIIGGARGMYIKDCYYLSGKGNGVAYNENNSSTVVNVMAKTEEQLKLKSTYLNFDFDNVWAIDDDYPYFKDFNYIHLSDVVVSELNLAVGQSRKIDIKYSPDNASIKKMIYKIADTNIASVDNDGNVMAISEGETTLTIKTLDGSNITKEVKIVVTIPSINLDDYEIIDDKYIKVNPMMDKDSFIDSLKASDFYEVKLSSEGEYVATGDKLSIYDKEDNLEEEYEIFILGDVTGTGNINVSDVAKIYQYIKGTIDMEDVYIKAADVVSDNELKVNDVAKLYQYIKNNIESLEE